jgi:hypothetical protein
MIKIRYPNANELPPGLHATAERHGRTITVYLLPGLTAEERNAALRRLRLSGRMGHGPRLPGVPLAFALSADRIRTTIAQAGSVFRKHPAGTTGPVMLVSAGAIAFLVLSAVSIRILREPRGPDGPPASGPAPAASAIAVRIPGSSQRPADNPAGSEGRVLTTALTGSDPLPLPTSPALPGNGSGAGPDTATGTGSSTGTGGGGSPVGAGADSTPNPTASATAPDVPPATVSVSTSATAPPAPVPSSDPASASVPAPSPSPVSASAAPSVSASVAPSVSVSGSGLPSVPASVPASAYTSSPVTASASVTATVSASLPTSGSASSAGSSAPAQSPPVTASVTGGACLDVGPLGVCLDV